MKKDVHPVYFRRARVRCACGAAFTVGSTKESIEVEICSQCHPLYTGKGKIIDVAGRVERFRTRAGKAVMHSNVKKQRVKKQKQS